ncbi:hypothetical protein BGZ61DRAFT_19279 [Ilyonectria robusta]|uniref:uncharacterized protein n=1 Tax=Ilyonectria robusta TaxID=1079257 RepID=UPI001E8D437C|nr:uncharacterized protein BGZ61DRAFT_19279 [Ilyonectria robusta]KAH8737620.1 hypothetical protein BGZ61DRAFT_19279 [Ilyonectria robusta]
MAPRYGRIRYGARQGSKGLGRKQGVGRQGRWACSYLIPTLIRIAVVTRVSRCGLSRRLIRSSSSTSFSASAVLDFFLLLLLFLPSHSGALWCSHYPLSSHSRGEPSRSPRRTDRTTTTITSNSTAPTFPSRQQVNQRSRPAPTHTLALVQAVPASRHPVLSAQAPSNYLGRSKEARRRRRTRIRKRVPRRSLSSARVGVRQRVRRRPVCSSVSSSRRNTSLVPAGASRCL